MPLIATFDPVNSRIRLAITGLSGLLGMPYYVERRANGTTWEGVRGAYPGYASAGQINVDDYEFTPNVTNEYRIRTDLVYDTYTRVRTDTWGYADSGQLWTHNGVGAAANWDVAAGVGTYTMADATGTQGGQGLLAVNVLDSDIRGIIQLSATPTGNGLYGQVRARGNAGNNIVYRMLYTTGNSLDLQIYENGVLLGTVSNVLSGVTAVAVHFRFQTQGRRYRGKVWTGSLASEPANWTISFQGALNPVAGDVRIEGLRNVGNTNVNPVLSWENFRVADLATLNPQYSYVGGDLQISDTFTRVVASGWGSADQGGAYTRTGGNATDWAVNGTKGTDTLANATSVTNWQALAASITNFDLTVSIDFSQLATGAGYAALILARMGGTSLSFVQATYIPATNNVNLQIVGNNGVSTLATVNGALTGLAINTQFKIRFTGTGQLLRMKAWLASNPEPDAWSADVLDTVPATPGGFGLGGVRLTSNTNVSPIIRFDDLLVTNMAANVYETLTPVQNTVWLKFPLRPFLNRQISLCNWSEEEIPSRGRVFEVLGRRLPVATNDVRGSRRFTATIVAVDSDEAEAIQYALSFGDTVLLQTPGPILECALNRRLYPEMAYFSLDDTTYTRVLDGVATMTITQPMVEVAAPDASLEYSNATWQGIINAFATWGTVVSTFPNWAAVMAYVSAPSDEVVG